MIIVFEINFVETDISFRLEIKPVWAVYIQLVSAYQYEAGNHLSLSRINQEHSSVGGAPDCRSDKQEPHTALYSLPPSPEISS